MGGALHSLLTSAKDYRGWWKFHEVIAKTILGHGLH